MCLTASHTKPKVAEKDILVYKVIGINNSGWLQDLKINGKSVKWQRDYLYEEDAPFVGKEEYSGVTRLHGNCFHSCKTKDEAESLKYSNDKIVQMIIPKGTLYYEGEDRRASAKIFFPKKNDKRLLKLLKKK